MCVPAAIDQSHLCYHSVLRSGVNEAGRLLLNRGGAVAEELAAAAAAAAGKLFLPAGLQSAAELRSELEFELKNHLFQGSNTMGFTPPAGKKGAHLLRARAGACASQGSS